MPPDVNTLRPAEASALCRFCLQPQKPGTLQPPIVTHSDTCLRSWRNCEMGLLYAQLTGGEELHSGAISDGWCLSCAQRMRQAVETLRLFRMANAFWMSYLRAIKVDPAPTDECNIDSNKIGAYTVRPAGTQPQSDDIKPDSRKQRITTPQPKNKTPTVIEISSPNKPSSDATSPSQASAGAAVQCDICGRMFSHMVPLRRHFRDVHRHKFRYTCDVCQQPHLTRPEWRRHRARHRPRQPPYACDQCANTYQVLTSLRQHVARVHVHEEQPCPHCRKSFQNTFRLRDHMIRHRPKAVACTEPACPRMFWLTKEMRVHVRTVHQKIRQFLCDGCGRAFLLNAQLKKHVVEERCPGKGGGGGGAGRMA